MEFTIDQDPDDSGRRALLDLIIAFNNAQTGTSGPSQKLSLLVRDPATGAVRGGLRGESYYGWLFVELLVLSEELRGQGLGTRLMGAAEAEAGRRGLIGVWLDTFSFQARPFYQRLGYHLVGRIDDFPPGGARYWLAKRLDGRPPVADNPPR